MSLSAAESLLIPVFMFLLMLGMGATLSLEDFRMILRRPLPVMIGLASQYGWMPLIAWLLALTLDLPLPIAIGLIITGCTAGGPISNFFTYIARGDLALSIAMTATSTLCGFLLIPLTLFFYTTSLLNMSGEGQLAIPHWRITATLLAILVPVGLGMLLRSRNLAWARRAERGATVIGFVLILVIVVGIIQRESDTLLRVDWRVILACILLGPMGFLLGYFFAWLLKLGIAQRRAVSLETGSQNTPLALAIVLISFPPEIRSDILVAPLIYGMAIVPLTALAAWLCRITPTRQN